METGGAIAIGAAALLVVFLFNRQREAQTAAMIAAHQAQQFQPGGTLPDMDRINILGTVASAYFGGASGAADFVKGIK